MVIEHDYSVNSARRAAERDGLAGWVAAFLASPGSDNADLADQLAVSHPWWAGPVELPISQLNRLAGPPGEPVIQEVDDDEWRDDVDDLAEEVAEGWDPPPVIATHDGDQLILEDGNHRVEGLRRAGRTAAWGVVGFAGRDERDRFRPPAAD